MRVLLISPEAPNTFWSLKNALKFTSQKAMLPPLGLLTVAAMLPEDWEITVVDMAVEKLHDADIEAADYVFLTGMHVQRECVDSVIGRCKLLGAKIVGGGPIFTAFREDYEHVDHLVLNEAEITLPQFLADLERGEPKRVYETAEWADVAGTPIPRWDLTNVNKYGVMAVQYSRGCPFGCDFCNVTTLFGRKMRTKSADQMIAELDSIYATGWRGKVFVVDDNFIGNKANLKRDILPAMIAWMKRMDQPFRFHTQVSINLADDEELLQLMSNAGFDCVFVGIETADEECLSECNKMQNKNRNLIDCVKKIQSYGMEVQAGFIVGFDSDRGTVFESLIQFIQRSGIVTAMVGLLNAPRGTELYERMESQNRLLEDGSGDNTDFSINFIPKMDREELIEGYKKVVATIYSPKFYYERILTFLQSYTPFDTHYNKLGIPEIKALFRSIWLLGVVHPGRRYYWKLLFRSLRSPQQLNLMITFAIYGFHFRKVFAA